MLGPFLTQVLQTAGKEGLHEMLVKAFKALFMHSHEELTPDKEHEISQSAKAIVAVASAPPPATGPVAQAVALATTPALPPKPAESVRQAPLTMASPKKVAAKKTAPKRATTKKSPAKKSVAGKAVAVKTANKSPARKTPPAAIPSPKKAASKKTSVKATMVTRMSAKKAPVKARSARTK